MLFPFALLSVITTAVFCVVSNMIWPVYLWAVPLMLVGFFVGWILVYVIFLLVVCLCTNTKKEHNSRSRFYHSLVLFTVRVLLGIFRVKPEASGSELIPTDSRWLLVGNHRSGFDPIVTFWALRKHELAFIAKPSIFKIPIANQLLTRDFSMPIDRENNREALKTILKAADLIKKGITSIGIYPEGTRTKDGNMLPFRSGAFKIAQRAKVPVVVVTIEGTENIMKHFPLRSTKVKLIVHHVFDAETVAAESTNDLSDKAKEIMLAHLGK